MVIKIMMVIGIICGVLLLIGILVGLSALGNWANNEEKHFTERRKRLAERKKENDRLEKWLNRPF